MVGMSSSSPETPFSLYKNACDNCGKSFEHSCSYRRHLRTHCNSQTRKRRRRRLWIPDQAACSEEDEDIGSMDFLDTSSECLTEGEFGKVSPQEFPGIDVLRQELTDHADSQEDPQELSFQQVSESEPEDEHVDESNREATDHEDGREDALHWNEEDARV
ncbi:hypothetical protein P5673_027563 [Acropora cervicornis]|uniref:C2H2-type domain-containing protein n=1 Tax=Acropora cervicornis TaxID=6130 RepID=A0AAD9UVL1_ACRCE|nr:hypothetical protein P5673_027563 [Acropora cervicornis]